MDKQKLINDVRHILDEQDLLSEQDYGGEDALPIDERIEALYPSAMNDVQRQLPTAYLQTYDIPKEIEADLQDGTGYVALPNDFLRLGTFKMRGWRQACTTTVSEDSDAYAFQLIHATRGGCMYPVTALVEDGKRLRYFSLPRFEKEHVIEKATYVRAAQNIETDEIRPRGYDVLIWWLAKSVAASFGLKTDNLEAQLKLMINGN